MPPAQQEATARPLPKFGEWDLNNPASGDGFTYIFNKARDEKKTNKSGKAPPNFDDNKPNTVYPPNHTASKKVDKKQKKLLCCFYGA